ncbi:MAG: hypothetical protein ACOYXB_03000 [Bacteroidota bacterium]
MNFKFKDGIMQGILILLGFILLLSFAEYQSRRIKREAKSDFAVFNSKRLDGKIIKVSYSSGLMYFILDNTDEEYSFSPIEAESNKDKLFYITAAPGDSIFKMSFSDTLLLIHKGQKYYYTFYKY